MRVTKTVARLLTKRRCKYHLVFEIIKTKSITGSYLLMD